jgi:glutamine synthetase
VNFSLVDAEGRSAFVDETDPDGISTLARHCIAGLVEHHQALTAISAPTVNAYRRLQPGELAGYWANWGFDHRMVATRVPDGRGRATRLESRVADGAANVHTAIAAVLQAARLGVEHQLVCPDPLVGDGFEDGGTDVASASSLAEALGHLAADPVFTAALSDELVANFIAIKEAEWERYIAEVGPDGSEEITQWELDEYLPYH